MHSLETLNMFIEYDDFMESIGTVADLGCGAEGNDLIWWATRTTRDEYRTPLKIKCTGIDIFPKLPVAKEYPNITFQSTDFENTIHGKYDVLWCHDAFQYCVNPIETLNKWHNITNDHGMLAIVIPDTISVQQKQLSFVQPSGCFYHHTIVSLIHMLAITGWDCRSGFFSKRPQDPWLHAVVYKNGHVKSDPKKTTWYDLVEKKCLPDSADASIMRHGYLRQQDLVLPWLDHSLTILGKL
jgi:SAM-dependent methyltransferase